LLRHVRLLLTLLLLHLLLLLFLGPRTSHQPEQSTHGGADGGTLAGIASDGAADRAQSRTT